MLQSLRERLTLLLVFLLPFHALLITFATKLIAGPDHAPLSLLSLWKEGVLAIILILALLEIFRNRDYARVQFDVLDWTVGALVAWSVIVTLLTHRNPGLFAIGFRYDFLPLVAFSVLRHVPWSIPFRATFARILIMIGAVVAVYGIATLFQPDSFFRFLGYSDLHSLYLPDHPIAAFQQIENSSLRRIQSTFSGPNQLGLWMLLPFSLFLLFEGRTKQRLWWLGILNIVVIMLTYSRSAWIAAVVVLAVSLWVRLDHRIPKRVIASGVAILGIVVLVAAVFSPTIIGRLSSTRGHFEKPLQAMQLMMAHPLGMGLGTAGPASNRVSEACVMLRPQDDPSWAKDRPNLCVFLGDKQVQPTDHACKCPLLTENWYLQIGVELGFVGFFLFLAFTILILIRTWQLRAIAAFLTFLGLSVASLFLHAWEDPAVAWTIWILLAFNLPRPPLMKEARAS